MKKYSQLTDVQRYQIEALKKAEKDQKTIASIIGVSASTISRELKRNTGQRGYRPKQAHIKALKRREGAAKVIKMTEEVITMIEAKIQLDWSPEQVSGWLSKEHDISISHERIYQHVREDKRQDPFLRRDDMNFCTALVVAFAPVCHRVHVILAGMTGGTGFSKAGGSTKSGNNSWMAVYGCWLESLFRSYSHFNHIATETITMETIFPQKR